MKTLFATVRQPSVTPTQAGGNNGLLYTAQSRYSGKAGEAISITLLDNGANKPLVVSVNGLAISVQLATDASDTITTIANDIVDAIDRHQDARALVFVQCTEGSGEGTGPARAVSQTFLAGGTGVGVSGANVVVFTRDMAGVNPFTVILENTDGANATGAIATEWAPTASGPWTAIDGAEGAWPGSLAAGAVVTRAFVDKPLRFFRLKVSQGASPSSVMATVVGG